MDRKEAAKLLPIIKAFSEGKTLQIRQNGSEWMDTETASFIGFPSEYRIKPELTYRPFANAEECWQELLKHEPFGWYKDKDGDFFMVSAVSNQGLRSLQAMFENGDTFVDGFPFGVKVEE